MSKIGCVYICVMILNYHNIMWWTTLDSSFAGDEEYIISCTFCNGIIDRVYEPAVLVLLNTRQI